MGVAIIGMTYKNTATISQRANGTSNSTDSNQTLTQQEFSWSSTFEGIILTSFNLGSVITPIIIGYIATRYGGRLLMTICLLSGGVFTVLLPVSARANPALIIVLRLGCGIALSGTDSLVQAMWARWAPLYEKASLTSLAYLGLSVAGCLTYLLSGYLVAIGGEGKGWPYIFYVFGSASLLLAPLWFMMVFNSPEGHPRISKKELSIIALNKLPEKSDKDTMPLNIPWREIWRSKAVWVVAVGHIANKWILSFMLSYLPRFFVDLFDFTLEQDGLYSSLPFVGRIVSGIVAGHLSDFMLVKGVSVGTTRKLFQATGCCGCAVFCLLIAFLPSVPSGWSITLLVLALSFQNLTSVAFRINLLDIAPRYAGLLNGVVSTIGTLLSLPAPVVTSLLISGGSRQGWQFLFCLVAGINVISGVIYILYAKGEIQDWAMPGFVGYRAEGKEEEAKVSTTDVGEDTGITEEYYTPSPTASEPESRRTSKSQRRWSRRATIADVASFLKHAQSHAFSNLAYADL